MPFKPDKHEEELIKLYREAFLNVVQTIQVKEARGQVTVFYKDQLKGILSILQDLDDQTDKWIKKAIPEIYKDNQREVINLVNKIGMQKDIRPQFAQIHQRAIDAAAQNIGDNLRNALNFAGRRISDEYREISLAAAGVKLAAGRSVAQMAQDLANRLNERGLPALKDKAGRTWSMETYTRMVARTTTRELGSIATQNTCAEFGCDYVYIPFHPLDKEDICSQYADKVYCISGNDPKYPKFTEEARPPYHPNCRHTLQPYVPAIRDMTDQEIDDLIKEAPEILGKLGFEIPKAPDRKKDPAGAAGEGIKPKNKAKNDKVLLQEAEEYAKNKGVKIVDYKKISLEIAQSLNKALDTLPADVRPKGITDASTAFKAVGSPPTGTNTNEFYGVTIETPATIKHNDIIDFDGGNVVGMNTRKYKTIEAMTARKKEVQELYKKRTGRTWFFNETGETTTFHEMGHVYENIRGIPKGFETAAKKWANDTKCDMIKKTSEAWAEAWGAYYGGYADKLPEYIAKYIREAK